MAGRGSGRSGSRPAGDERRGQGIAWNRLITLVLAGAAVFALGLWLYPSARRAEPAPPATSAAPDGAVAGQVVRPDSHRLSTAPDGKVTFVEFLDFECEGCRAAFPVVEDLRQRYDGRVTFVLRYFPLESHFNAERAARAVEASARQGQLEAMYRKMYETQTQWGEQQVPADATFRGFAAELGLDLARWDTDYASPEVAARVRADADDAAALGLTGTPSFFVNGQPLQPESVDDLTRALDEALAR